MIDIPGFYFIASGLRVGMNGLDRSFASSQPAQVTRWNAKPDKIGVLLRLAIALVFSASPVTTTAQKQPPIACASSDKDCASKALTGHTVSRLAFWEAALAKPLEQRIAVAPPELVEYLNYDNIANGFPERPRAARLGVDFRRDVQRAFAEIPSEVKRLLAPKLAGIYFVENLGGTGYTDQIVDVAGKGVAGYIVLDVATLNKRSANAWATWKENTPFAARSGFRLTAEIETPRHNNRKNAIQYILLHELAHVLAINENFHPFWGIEPKDIASTASLPFFLLSWAVDGPDNQFVTLFDTSFPERKDVVYYFGAKLAADQMVATYDHLERTNFVTLYAVTRPGDDFAETFASYVHTVLMKKLFAIRIYRHGKLAKVYRSCWDEARCAEKRKLIERFLNIAG